MIRSINDQFGFADRYTTNEMIMDWDRYPTQNTDAIGKYLSLNFFAERGRFMKYRIRIRKDLKEEYSNFISSSYEQSVQEVFRILRFDMEEPFKVILVSLGGQVVVTTKDKIESLVYINDPMCAQTKQYITDVLGERYYEPTNIVDNYEDFFTEFTNEQIEVYPVQNQKMLLKPVYIEWMSDVTNYDIDYNEGPEKNDHSFTDKIKEQMIKNNVRLFGLTDREINSYPYIHDIHGESYVDDPRRVKSSRGYIIRADQNGADPQIVVMYQYGQDTRDYRVITLDEARFYYITNVEERKQDVEEREIYTALYNYIVYGTEYVPTEKIIDEIITDERDARDEDAWELTDLDCGFEEETPDDGFFDFGFGFEEDQSFLWDFESPEFDFNLEPGVLQDPDILDLEVWDFDRNKDEPDDETWDFDTNIIHVDDDPDTVVYDFFYDPLYLDQTDLFFDFDIADDDESVPFVYDFEVLSEPYMDPDNVISPDTEIWDFTTDEEPSEDDVIYDFYRDFTLDEDNNPVYPSDWEDVDPAEDEPIDFGYDIEIHPDDKLQIWDYEAEDETDDEISWDFDIQDDEFIFIYDCNE